MRDGDSIVHEALKAHDLYFGPVAPDGLDSNWVETLPGKSWFQLFRIYGPLQPWFNQTWRLNEFERLDEVVPWSAVSGERRDRGPAPPRRGRAR